MWLAAALVGLLLSAGLVVFGLVIAIGWNDVECAWASVGGGAALTVFFMERATAPPETIIPVSPRDGV